VRLKNDQTRIIGEAQHFITLFGRGVEPRSDVSSRMRKYMTGMSGCLSHSANACDPSSSTRSGEGLQNGQWFSD
jgi:hypothetical protein